MTAATTQRENLSRVNGGVPRLNSPAVPARARARVPVTVGTSNLGDRVRAGVSTWWAWTSRPTSLRATWRLSAVDPKRIPAENTALRVLWHVSNWSDRLLIYALILLLPTVCTGPLRWCAQRPTRRWALYLTLAALTGAYLIGRK